MFKNFKQVMVLVIAEPTYSSFIYKIVDRYTLASLYDDFIRYSSMDVAQKAGHDKAIEMGYTEEI